MIWWDPFYNHRRDHALAFHPRIVFSRPRIVIMAAINKDVPTPPLYRAPMVEGPTLKELEDLSIELGLGIEGTSELAKYHSIINATSKELNQLDELVEPRLPVKYPRTPGFRPSREDNQLNAWYYKSTIHGAPSGKLAGKRVAIKDSIAVAGIPMMMGCYALEGYVPDFDATVVTRILDEGGTILGKSTCEDLCYSGSSHSSATGPVLNPINPRCSAGGSSSGSTVLVACNEVDLAIGGDQGGSVRMPASWCGVVGLKPTFGLVPYTGASSGEFTVDHLGPITRTVEDCALLLQAIAGYDEGRDARQPCNIQVPDYVQHLKDPLPDKLRIGVLREGFGLDCSDPAVDQLVRDVVDRFGAALEGVDVSEVSIPLHSWGRLIGIPISDMGGVDGVFTSGGVGLHHTGYYPTSMMKQVGTLLKANFSKLVPAHKTGLLHGTYLKKNYCSLYGKVRNICLLLNQSYEKVLKDVDVVVMPTVPFTAPELPSKDASMEDILWNIRNMTYNTKATNLTGHPAISINAGSVGGMPVGLQLVGRKFDELHLLQVAHAFEQFLRVESPLTLS